jgi:hypothetical protein
MNLKFLVVFFTSFFALTACLSNTSAPAQNSIAKGASVIKPAPEVKTPDGKIISLLQVSDDLPSTEANKVALTPTVVTPNSDISIHLENTEEFNYILYKKNELDGGAWENITGPMPVRNSIKVPKEKGTFVVCLAIVMKSGKTAKYFFAIDVH